MKAAEVEEDEAEKEVILFKGWAPSAPLIPRLRNNAKNVASIFPLFVCLDCSSEGAAVHLSYWILAC